MTQRLFFYGVFASRIPSLFSFYMCGREKVFIPLSWRIGNAAIFVGIIPLPGCSALLFSHFPFLMGVLRYSSLFTKQGRSTFSAPFQVLTLFPSFSLASISERRV